MRTIKRKIIRPLFRLFWDRIISAVIMSSLIISSCAPIIDHRGYIFDQEKVDLLKEGVTNYEQVEQIMGTASLRSTVGTEALYYISSRFETHGYEAPQEVDRKIFVAYFDADKILSKIAHYGLEDGYIVNFIDRKTQTRGREYSLIQQLFGNLGRFDSGGTSIGN